jgi:hypothetical protein
VKQRGDDPEQGALRAELIGTGMGRVVAVDQARDRQRHVQGVAQVMIRRVAGAVAGPAALEQIGDIAENTRQAVEVVFRVAHGQDTPHFLAYRRGFLHVDAIGDVVMGSSSVHGCRRFHL